MINILNKKNHYFSRVHVLDMARLIAKILYNSNRNNFWNIVDELPTTREEFMNRIIKLKNIKNFNFINYEENKEDAPVLKRKFWESNKKVSNRKIKKEFEYSYIFPTYFSGLKYTVKNS